MSADRIAEIIKYLNAISRDIGDFRQETNTRLERIEARVESLEREGREQRQQMYRFLSLLATTRADIEELQDRVEALERKLA